MKLKCKCKNKQGGPCQAKVMGATGYCYLHNPDAKIQKARRDAQSRGGRGRGPKGAILPALEFHLDDPLTIPRTLSKVAELVYLGQLSAKVGATIARLVDCALRALEAGTVAEEVAHLKHLADAEQVFSPETDTDALAEANDDVSFRQRVIDLKKTLDQQAQQRAASDSVKPEQDGNDPETEK